MKLEKCFMCGAPAPSVLKSDDGSYSVECLACDTFWGVEPLGSAPTPYWQKQARATFYENVITMAPSEFYLTLTTPPLLPSEIWALKSFERCFYTDRPEILNVLLFYYVKVYGFTLNRPLLDKDLAHWKRCGFASADDAFAYVKKVFARKKIEFAYSNVPL